MTWEFLAWSPQPEPGSTVADMPNYRTHGNIQSYGWLSKLSYYLGYPKRDLNFDNYTYDCWIAAYASDMGLAAGLWFRLRTLRIFEACSGGHGLG